MNTFQRLAHRAKGLINEFLLEDPRALSILGGGYSTYAGPVVTPDNALQSVAVWACVSFVSEAGAVVPAGVYQPQGHGRAYLSDHWLQRLIDRPNPEMSGMDFRVAMNVALETWGNAYAVKVLRKGGETVALWPLRSNQVEIRRNEDKSLYYRHHTDSGPVDYPESQIFHVRALTLDGVSGLSPIAQCRQALGRYRATEEYGARFFGNGAKPSVVLEIPAKLNAEQRRQIIQSWQDHNAGLENAHSVAVVEAGTKIQVITIPPEDAQFLQTTEFSEEQIARLYRVPPHLIGLVAKTTSWGTGIEQMGIGFVTYSLLPRLKYWEEAISRSLLTESDRASGVFVKHEVKGLLRGDQKARYEAYAMALNGGWMNRNEVRALEELGPMPGGDIYTIQSQYIPIDQAGKILGGAPNGQPTQ